MKKTFEQVLQKAKDKLFGKDKGYSNDTNTNDKSITDTNEQTNGDKRGGDKTNEQEGAGGIFSKIGAIKGQVETEQRQEGGILNETQTEQQTKESLSTYVKTEQRRSGGITQSILNFKEQENREAEASLLNKAYKKQAIKSYEEFIDNNNSLETTNQNNSSNNNLITKDNPQKQNHKTTKKKKNKGNSR